MTTSTTSPPRVAVWDPLVRIGHWLLVTAFTVAWLTADDEAGDPDFAHVWAGYVVGVIVVLRVTWGFIGTRHARFSDFVRSPGPALRYLRALLRGTAPRHLGHTPAGGAMIVALLICLSGTVGTGLIEYGNRGKGPLADAGSALITRAYADKGENHRVAGGVRRGEQAENESILGEIHGLLANVTLALVALYVLGVAVTSLVHRENLIAAMISGNKRPE